MYNKRGRRNTLCRGNDFVFYLKTMVLCNLRNPTGIDKLSIGGITINYYCFPIKRGVHDTQLRYSDV